MPHLPPRRKYTPPLRRVDGEVRGEMMHGIDVETTALDPADGELSLVQIADPANQVVRVYDVLGGGKPQLPDRGIAHNATFEERWLRTAGYSVQLEDTMIASQVFYTGTNAAKGKLSHTASPRVYPAS